MAGLDFRYNNRVALGCDDQDRANRILRVLSESVSPISALVKPDAKEETPGDTGGAERSVRKGRRKANQRWKTRPRRRSGDAGQPSS